MEYSDFCMFKKPKGSSLSCLLDTNTTIKCALVNDEHSTSNDENSFPSFFNPIADGFDNCELCDAKAIDPSITFEGMDCDYGHVDYKPTKIRDFKFDPVSKPTGIVVAPDGITPISDVLNKITMLTFNTGLLELRLLGMQVYQNPPFTQRRLMHMPSELINSNADVIALQEVYAKSHAHFLTTHMKSNYPYIVRANYADRDFILKHNLVFKRPKMYQTRFRNKALFHHGLMFLSKFPIIFAQFHSWRDVTYLEGIFGNKGYMEVICDVPTVGLVTFFNIHMASAALNPESKKVEQLRLAEIKQLFDSITIAIENNTVPVVIGDLNASPDNCSTNYHYFLEQGWIDSWNVAKRRRRFKIRRRDNDDINSALINNIQSLRYGSCSNLLLSNRRTQLRMPLSSKSTCKKLSLRVMDFHQPLSKSPSSQSISQMSTLPSDKLENSTSSIVERLNNIGLDSKKVINKPSINTSGRHLRMTKTFNQIEPYKQDYIHNNTIFVETDDDFVCKRSNSWHLFDTNKSIEIDCIEEDYSHLDNIQAKSFECPEVYSLKQGRQMTIKMYGRESSIGHAISEPDLDPDFYTFGRLRGSNSISIYKGSYRINYFSHYDRLDNYHRKSYSPNNRFPSYTKIGLRRRILDIKKNSKADEHTWDPLNPLNKIGPHSSCSGLRCDYIFLPPANVSKNLINYSAKWSEILFTEPCVLVDQDLQNCNFAYSICMSMKKLMLVTISDHYALKIVLVHKGTGKSN